MNSEFLGDSYDLVKRFFASVLESEAKLWTSERFIADDLYDKKGLGPYHKVTGIRVLRTAPKGKYSILNDPDTGVRSPRRDQADTRRHISLDTIRDQLRESAVFCVVTYDQSFSRSKGKKKKTQQKEKLRWLSKNSLHAFYYDSHASFLFAFRSKKDLGRLRGLLRNEYGIPKSKLVEL